MQMRFCHFKFRIDKFVLKTKDVGVLYRVVISHDNTGTFPGWFLNKVSPLIIYHNIRKRANWEISINLSRDTNCPRCPEGFSFYLMCK